MDRKSVYERYKNKRVKKVTIYSASVEHTYIVTGCDYGYNKWLCDIRICDTALDRYEHLDKKQCNFYRYSDKDNTLYYSIPSEINGMLVIYLDNTISYIANKIAEKYQLESITLDFTECDLCNILDMRKMFTGIKPRLNIRFPKGKYRVNPVSTEYMFSCVECSNINEVFREIDFSNTVYTRFMLDNSKIGDIDLAGVKFDSLEYANGMFYACDAGKISASCGTFNNVKAAIDMFFACVNLKEFDISCFNSNTLSNARQMFKNATSLERITGDWSGVFGTLVFGSCIIENIFEGCRALRYIDVEGIIRAICDINADFVHGISRIFTGCSSIEWAEKYEPFHLKEFYGKSGIVNSVLASFDCRVLNVAGIRVDSDLKVTYNLQYRCVDEDSDSYDMPGLLVVDSLQYEYERDGYTRLERLGKIKVLFIKHEDINSAVAKYKLFDSHKVDGKPYVFVDLG